MAAVNNQDRCLQVNKFTGIIILLLLHLSCPIVIYVDTCPKDTESWVERSRKFLCKDPSEIYHCIQSISGHLIETCMKGYVIKSYKVGCPLIRIHNRTSRLHYPFRGCNTTTHGCPKPFHREYSTNELYLYPACIYPVGNTTSIRRDSVKEKNTTFDSEAIHIAELITEEPKSTGYAILISIGLFFLGICLGGNFQRCYGCLHRVLPATYHNLQRFASVRNYHPTEVVFINKTEDPCQTDKTIQPASIMPGDSKNTAFNDHASDKTIRVRNVTTVNTAEQELPDNAESYTNGES